VAELTGRMMKWWVVSVTLRQWSGWTAALQAAHDLYVTNDPVNGCGGRIRTGDTRRMKPLPSRLATPRLWKMGERSAGLSRRVSISGPAGWSPRSVLGKMKTNTTASPVGGLAPAGRFHGGSFGVSGTPPGAVFITAKPLVCDILTRAWKQAAFVRSGPSLGRSA
jgi:hypothetical protein